jgi:hypothetical protein
LNFGCLGGLYLFGRVFVIFCSFGELERLSGIENLGIFLIFGTMFVTLISGDSDSRYLFEIFKLIFLASR